MTKLIKQPNYIQGKWVKHKKDGLLQIDAIDGSIISSCSSDEVDFKAVLKYGRETGGPALRKMTFHERGRMIKALALHLHGIRKKYYPISYLSGATKSDSWIDIEGGIGNLFAYASLRKKFPNETFYTEGEAANLSRGGTFIAVSYTHLTLPTICSV